eukprot:6765061-Ditylum_brightwellii.AAC.1
MSYHTEPAENTDDTIRGFVQVLNSIMGTVDNIVLPDGIEVEEDHLSDCWTAPPCSIYIRHYMEKHAKTSSTTQASTVSTVTDSNSPAGEDHQTTGETVAFLCKAAKQLYEWETATKAHAKEQEESEKEISAALDMLNEAKKHKRAALPMKLPSSSRKLRI